ncbi:MAG: M48 family metalloprotease [Lachnospiraceae bacterium]|nr:M48 family metalloprotease [Lachnospiraceae bacterium]
MKKILFGVSAGTFALLYGLLALILLIVFHFTNVPLVTAVIITAVVIVLQFLISPFLTDLTQRWFYKTQFGVQVPDYLRVFIEDVCRENNMKYPKIGIINDGAPNAFTYGHTKNNARVVLTRGIFELLTEDEVKSVVAHELGHAAHYDMILMTMANLVPLVMYAVFRAMTEAMRVTDSKNDDNKAALVEGAIAAIAYILYILTQYIVLWFSRTREYFADEFAVRATRDPEALSRALIQIGFGLSTHADTRAASDQKNKNRSLSVTSTNAMGIFDTKASKSLVVSCYEDGEINKAHIKNAMKWELWNTWAKWYELNSTHPLISKRLEAIDKLAPEFGRAPFVNFDLVKPESYLDDFAREIGISILPGCSVIAAVVTGFIFLINETYDKFWISAALLVLAAVLSMLKYLFTHPNREYAEANVAGLLGEPKVSGIRSIPCELKGTVIGRGDPGCIFNEDYVIQDETGIMFLDYNQPLFIINKIFALFKSKENIDRYAVVKGWYRRAPIPYVEIYTMEVNGKTKKVFTYGFGWIWRWIVLILTAALTFALLTGIIAFV